MKLHTDSDSATAAEHFGARAFAVGQDIHLGAGEYTPGTKEGDRLLAHEIAHTVQAQASGVQGKAHSGHRAATTARDSSGVSQPQEPAEQEADMIGDHVASMLHAEASQDFGLQKPPIERAPRIGAKLRDGAIMRMPKWRGGDDGGQGTTTEKGKSFRGGKKKDRDNWYGFDDPDFQNWWHRVGKQEFGHGKDIDNRKEAEAAYGHWVALGRPRGGK